LTRRSNKCNDVRIEDFSEILFVVYFAWFIFSGNMFYELLAAVEAKFYYFKNEEKSLFDRN